MKIKKEQRHLVLSMALGDGTLNSAGYLSIRHSLKQEDYLLWKSNLLNKNGIRNTGLYYVSNNGYGAFEMRTYSHKFIKLYRKVIYKNKKNIANKKLLKKLIPLHLAIWYMDDGGLSQKKRDGKVYANELMINTHLTKEENQIIIDYFREVWGVSFKQYKNRGKYRLSCATREARKFIEIVKPYVEQVPSMAHKINVKS